MLTNLAGAPASIVVQGGSGQNAQINAAFAQQLKALVKDAAGNAVSGHVVTFTAPTGAVASGTFAGGLSTTTATTDQFGFATSPVFTANTKAGTYSVTAGVGQVTPSATFTLTNTAGTVAKIEFLS